MMELQLCVTCSSSLFDSDGTTISLDSEKPIQPVFLTCGTHAVCGRCITRNDRLARYCVRCEDVGELVGGQRKKPLENSTLPDYDPNGEVGEEGLPTYNHATLAATSLPEDRKGSSSATGVDPSIHYLKSDETLSGLALRYRINGANLARLNKLPNSTLYTTPHLLHTLPFLLLPVGIKSMSAAPLLSAAEEHKRLTLRRFAVATRCADYNLGKYYVEKVFETRAKEQRGSAEIRVGGELEEAIEAYKLDESWEKSQKGKGKSMHATRIY